MFFLEYVNVTRGPNRFHADTLNHLDLALGVYPSPDSDAAHPVGRPDVPLTDNGFATAVFAAHPVLTGGRFTRVPFTGLATFSGRGWGTYATVYSRDVFNPEVDPAVAAPWDIRITNVLSSGDTALALRSPALDVRAVPELVTDVAMSGPAATPTFSWVPHVPTGRTSDTIFLLYRRVESGVVLVHFQSLAGDADGYALPSALSGGTSADPQDARLRAGEQYLVLLLNRVLADDGRLLGSADTSFEFRATAGGPDQPLVYLPTVTTNNDGDPVFNFDVAVNQDELIFIDPDVAIGYDYAIGAGDPNFASVLLPAVPGADRAFDLFLFDALGVAFDTNIDILAEQEFDFRTALASFGIGAEGISRFGIRGIEVNAAIDPNDVRGFVTGLTFVSSGRFTGTQTPIIGSAIAVPTGGLPIAVSALMALGMAWRRRKPIPRACHSLKHSG